MHVLVCPNLGWGPDEIHKNGCRFLRNWWPDANDVHLIRLNLLCRSLRELCRRIWYANVMPNAFERRYRTEPRTHFLTLFRQTAPYFPHWPAIQRLAEWCEENWPSLCPVAVQIPWEQPIQVRPPTTKPPPPPSSAIAVFLSCHSRDYLHAAAVYQYLTARGVATFFCEQTLPGMGSTDFRKQIYKALDACRHMVVIARSGDRVRDNWVEAEWGFFLNERNSGRKKGNLVTLTIGQVAVEDLPPELRSYEIIAAPESGPDENSLARAYEYVRS